MVASFPERGLLAGVILFLINMVSTATPGIGIGPTPSEGLAFSVIAI